MNKMESKTSVFSMVMGVFVFIYVVGGVLFFVFSDLIAAVLQMPPAPNKFWVVLSVSMMAMLAYLSWQSSLHPKERAFVTCHLLAKSVSVVGFLVSFIFYQPLPAYLVGAVTDLSVIVIVAYFFRGVDAGGKSTSVGSSS